MTPIVGSASIIIMLALPTIGDEGIMFFVGPSVRSLTVNTYFA